MSPARRVRSCWGRSAHGRLRLITAASSLMRRLLLIWPTLSWSPTCGGTKRDMCGCIFPQTSPGGTCSRIQRCTGMSRGDEVAGVAFSPCSFFARRCATTGASVEYWLSSRASSCVSLRWLLGEFPAFLACAVHTWEIWSILSSRRRIWQSHVLCLGVACGILEHECSTVWTNCRAAPIEVNTTAERSQQTVIAEPT